MVVLAVNSAPYWGLARSVAQVTHKVDTGLVNYVWLVTDHAISATVPLPTCFISFFCLQPLHFHKCVYIICNRLPTYLHSCVHNTGSVLKYIIYSFSFWNEYLTRFSLQSAVYFKNTLLNHFFVVRGLYLLCWYEGHVFTEFGCI